MINQETKNTKTIIITGANTGLGYECAKNLAKNCETNNIILACRNRQRANDAVKSLTNQTGNPNISALELDLSSLESVRQFVNEFVKLKFPPLFAIVCNAGIQIVNGIQYTKDGFEMTFGVNHLGHFLLVNLLLGEMADNGKIVFVSSDTHDPLQKTGMPEPLYENAEELAYPQKSKVLLSGTRRYTTSKLCNLYCTYELAELIKTQTTKNITVNAFNPGMMPGTGLARNYNAIARFAWKYVLPVLIIFKHNVNTVAKSGKSLALLITDPKLDNISGRYFDGAKPIDSSKLSYNKTNREDLWKTSMRLVQLKKDEIILAIL